MWWAKDEDMKTARLDAIASRVVAAGWVMLPERKDRAMALKAMEEAWEQLSKAQRLIQGLIPAGAFSSTMERSVVKELERMKHDLSWLTQAMTQA